MGEIKKISTVHDFNALLGVEDRHPLISVIDFSAYPPRPLFRALLGVYGIYIREDEPQNVVYGTSKYDFLGGTLIAIAPGQISGAEDIGHPGATKGMGNLFDAELLHGTSLAQKIQAIHVLFLRSDEALHMQDSERETIVECLKHIRKELSGPQDEYNRTILVAYIEVLLNYCMRFYGRQFATRKAASKDILARFERLLTEYFDSGEPDPARTSQRAGMRRTVVVVAQLFRRPRQAGNRGNPARTHPTFSDRTSQKELGGRRKDNQRNCIRHGIQLSPSFEPYVQECYRNVPERICYGT